MGIHIRCRSGGIQQEIAVRTVIDNQIFLTVIHGIHLNVAGQLRAAGLAGADSAIQLEGGGCQYLGLVLIVLALAGKVPPLKVIHHIAIGILLLEIQAVMTILQQLEAAVYCTQCNIGRRRRAGIAGLTVCTHT